MEMLTANGNCRHGISQLLDSKDWDGTYRNCGNVVASLQLEPSKNWRVVVKFTTL